MLSDTCFECIDNLLDAIRDYDYTDEFKEKLTGIIMELNEIRDELDGCDDKRKFYKNDKKKSLRVAQRMVKRAIVRREMTANGYYSE